MVKELRMPGEIRRRASVQVPVRIEEGGELRGFETVHICLRRLDQRWRMDVEWVDHKGNPHRERLAHEVVARTLKMADSIMDEAKRDRAIQAAMTRAAKEGKTYQPKPKPRRKKKRKAKPKDKA
jgi:hypothetical protein